MKNRKQLMVIALAGVLCLKALLMEKWNLKPRDVERETAVSRKTAATHPVGSGRVTAAALKLTSAPPPPTTGAPNRNQRPGRKLVLDPAARAALKRVGSDPEAERYWLGAINNPLLPPSERKDLIEDLNEDGLSDPRHPDLVDLPLIATRIRLIEQLMPDALDQVNADAFLEAHKDLVNMYAKLTQR